MPHTWKFSLVIFLYFLCTLPLSSYGQTPTPIPTPSSDGFIYLVKEVYPCDGVGQVVVVDSDLRHTPSLQITISSNLDPVGFAVTLFESPGGSANFVGSFYMSSTGGIGAIHVGHNGFLSASYLDADTGTAQNVMKNDWAPIDCIAPLVQSVQSAPVSTNSVLVSDRKSTRLNSSHTDISRMPSSA